MKPKDTLPRTEITIQTLILPNFPRPEIARCLSPNGRAHWAVARKARLNVVDVVIVHAIRSGLRRMRGHVTMYPTWTFPRRGVHDGDNLGSGVMKATIDVIVKGGWLDADDTDHLTLMPPEIRIEKGVRQLELRFEQRVS